MAATRLVRHVPLFVMVSLLAGGCAATPRALTPIPVLDTASSSNSSSSLGIPLTQVGEAAWAVKTDAATGTYALETAGGRAVVAPGSRTIFVAKHGDPFAKRRLSQPVTLAGDGSLRVPSDFALSVPELLKASNAVQIATPPTAPAAPKIQFAPIPQQRGFTVVVDAGHGGKDPGACGPMCNEKECVLGVALALEPELRARGFEVVMTRRDDTFVELAGRVKISNDNKGDLFVSLHANATSSKKTSGTETIFASQEMPGRPAALIPQSRSLAQRIQQQFARNLPSPDRGAKTDIRSLHVLRNSKIPAVLVEMGFVTNPEEGKLLAASWYQKKLARLIAQAVQEWHAEHHAPRLTAPATLAPLAMRTAGDRIADRR